MDQTRMKMQEIRQAWNKKRDRCEYHRRLQGSLPIHGCSNKNNDSTFTEMVETMNYSVRSKTRDLARCAPMNCPLVREEARERRKQRKSPNEVV